MKTIDVLVIGAGPAGLSAALAAHDAGLSVLVVDENPQAGGQIYRKLNTTRLSKADAILGPAYVAGKPLLKRFLASGIETAFSTRVWQIDNTLTAWFSRVGKRPGTPTPPPLQARFVVLATGALERPYPLVGWTHPGVMTVGAGQILLKSAGLLPPPDTVLIGSGPLITQFAAQVYHAGGTLQAIIDTRGTVDRPSLLRKLPGLLRDPSLLWQGLQLNARVRRATLPILTGAEAIRLVDDVGNKQVSAIHFHADGQSHTLKTSSVLIHAGLIPDTVFSSALGLDHDWNGAQGAWQPRRTDWQESSRPGIFIAGDGGGIFGAKAAALSGQLAGLEIARQAGKISAQERDRQAAPVRKAWRQALAPRAFIDALYPIPATCLSPPDEAIVCRCENLTAGQLRQSIALGVDGPNQLKAFTRAGMGPCQGRQCASLTAALIAERNGINAAQVEMLRGRFPVKPVTLEEIAASVGNGLPD